MSHNAFASPGTLGYTGAHTRAGQALENAGIRTGEIIAWRAWRAVSIGGQVLLKSMAVDCIWMPGATMTINSILEQCGINRDRWERVPPGIGAGVHAFKTYQQVLSNYSGFHHAVYGTVALWGEVIEHTGGYRAEFGKINTIDVASISTDGPSMRDQLRKTYGVEGKSYRDFKIGT